MAIGERGKIVAGIVLGVIVGAVVMGSWHPSGDHAAFAGWRPLNRNELCPQGHVETFTDGPQGRQFERPRVDGHDVPCGMARAP